MLNMDPSKKSYASIVALDLTEDSSLPLNPQLHLILCDSHVYYVNICFLTSSHMEPHQNYVFT